MLSYFQIFWIWAYKICLKYAYFTMIYNDFTHDFMMGKYLLSWNLKWAFKICLFFRGLCLLFFKSEPKYAYKRYVYKKSVYYFTCYSLPFIDSSKLLSHFLLLVTRLLSQLATSKPSLISLYFLPITHTILLVTRYLSLIPQSFFLITSYLLLVYSHNLSLVNLHLFLSTSFPLLILFYLLLVTFHWFLKASFSLLLNCYSLNLTTCQ